MKQLTHFLSTPRVLLLIVASMFIMSPLFASASGESRESYILPEETPTFFWQIDGGAGRSYLLGTLHLGEKSATLPITYLAALLASDQLVTEVMAEDHTLGNLVEGAAQNPLGDLEKRLGSLRFEALYRRLMPHYTRETLQKLQPWAVLNMLENSFVPSNLSWKQGLDYQLIERAREYRKRRIALEDVDTHLRLLTAVPEPITIRAIDRALRYPHLLEKTAHDILSAYRLRDIPNMIQFSYYGDPKTFALYAPQDRNFWQNWYQETLLSRRNRAWIPKIEEAIKRAPTFIAIGVGHLYGEWGIVVQLQARGFRVTPIFRP